MRRMGKEALKVCVVKLHPKGKSGVKDNIDFWTNASDFVSWDILVFEKGRYKVKIIYACPQEYAGSRFTVGIEGGERLEGIVEATGS